MAGEGIMTALQAALAGLGGGIEGAQQYRAYEQKRKREEDLLAAQKQREEEAMALNRFNALRAAGFEFGTPRTTPDLAARNVTALETPALPTMTPQAGRSMLGRALQAGMGVTAGAPSMAAPRFGTAAELPALDTSKVRQFERGAAMQPATPSERIKVGGMELTVRAPETEEEKFARELKKLELQQDLIEKRTAAANDRANRGYFAILKKAGRVPDVEYDDVKDIDLKSAYDELKQERSLTGAMERAQFGAQLGTYLPGVVGPDNQPQIMFGTRGGAITPTGVGPVQTSDANIPDKERRNMTELEASVKELDKAIAAVKANKKAFGLQTMAPNMALTRIDPKGVSPRAVVTKSVSGFRRTEFGTALSKQEAELSAPIFPVIGGLRGGDDAEAVIDKLTAIRESAQQELDIKRQTYGTPAKAPPPARTPTAAPAKAPAQAQTLGQWMDANPQRQGETDAQYEARYKASAKGGQ